MRLFIHAAVQFQQGIYYALGKGVKENLTKALRCFESAANGDTIYWASLGHIYEKGIILPRDIKRAIECYEIGCNCGVKMAKFRLARLLVSVHGLSESPKEQAERARELLHQVAICEDYSPDYRLGGLAQYRLAVIFETGILGYKDLVQAYVWFYLASQNRVPHASNGLNRVHLMLSQEEAATAESEIGHAYEYGIGAPENMEKAASWYTQSAEHGDARAMYWLATNRYITKKDPAHVDSEVRKLMLLAAESPDSYVHLPIAETLLRGELGIIDIPKAIACFQKAANAGTPRAFYRLGFLYEEGKHVEKNLVKAFVYYEQACSRGVIEACEARDELNRILTPEQRTNIRQS